MKRIVVELQENPNDPRHGTNNGYGHGKCRCEPCKKAKSTYQKKHPLSKIGLASALMKDANDPRHGTLHGYSNGGCRCNLCKNAGKSYRDETIGADLSTDPNDTRHGTWNGYCNGGCRCDPCRLAGSKEMATRYQRNRETIIRRLRARKLDYVRRLPTAKYSRCDILLRDEGVSWMTGNPVDASDTKNVHVDHLIPQGYYIPGNPGNVLNNVALCEASLNIGRNNQLTSKAMQQFTSNVLKDVPDVSYLGNVLGELL